MLMTVIVGASFVGTCLIVIIIYAAFFVNKKDKN
jgi:hypothetical protein